MHKLLVVTALMLSSAAAGMASPPPGDSLLDCLLPARLTPKALEAKEGGTFTKVEFAGTTYWVLDVHFGYGVPYEQIGIYAPGKDGLFHLSLFAKSWAAGNIEAMVDKETGVLELRERANSKLKGQLVLSCNLRTIGTQDSTREK